MKLTLNKEDCIACGLCQVFAPNVFDYDEEGIVGFREEMLADEKEIQEMFEPEAKKAIQNCPTKVIKNSVI